VDRYDEGMFLGGKLKLSGLWMGCIALGLSSCADRFKVEEDPLNDYYANRPRYQDPVRSTSERPWTAPGSGLTTPPDVVAAQGGNPLDTPGHQGATPSPKAEVPATPVAQRPAIAASGPVNAHGGGAFKKFGNLEGAQIRESILGKNKIKQFSDFEPMVERMMDFKRWPKTLHTVKLNGGELIKTNFDMTDKFFCEDFSLADTKIPSFYNTNRSLRGRWEGPSGKQAIAEMQRVNRAHNQILRDYKAAKEQKDEARMAAIDKENGAYWKTFMSCLAYSESGVFWDRDDSKRWLSNWNDYGIYQLNPDQRAGGNLNDCAKNWNQEFPEEKIDEKKFRSDAAYRKTIVTTANQRFNTFCGLSKIQQNLAHQSARNEGCLNPFKKSYNHFGALMQNSDLNFLRCTSKLIPSPGATKTPLEAFESFRTAGKGAKESGASTH
jgi:hypothetical protein